MTKEEVEKIQELRNEEDCYKIVSGYDLATELTIAANDLL